MDCDALRSESISDRLAYPLRAACDTAESMMPHDAWPFPSYTDILMSVQ